MFGRQTIKYLGIVSRQFSKERAGKSVKPGAALVIDGIPHKVTKIIQGKRGKGGGFVRATLRSLSGSEQVFEKTFTSDEVVEHADLEKETVQYSWKDDNSYVFMNSSTFEEVRLPRGDVENGEFLLEGLEVKLLKFQSKVIGCELPVVCSYQVIKVDDTKASGPHNSIPATLETGAVVNVPLFIKVGTKVRINIEERTYIERG